jgi:hypothetical protein
MRSWRGGSSPPRHPNHRPLLPRRRPDGGVHLYRRRHARRAARTVPRYRQGVRAATLRDVALRLERAGRRWGPLLRPGLAAHAVGPAAAAVRRVGAGRHCVGFCCGWVGTFTTHGGAWTGGDCTSAMQYVAQDSVCQALVGHLDGVPRVQGAVRHAARPGHAYRRMWRRVIGRAAGRHGNGARAPCPGRRVRDRHGRITYTRCTTVSPATTSSSTSIRRSGNAARQTATMTLSPSGRPYGRLQRLHTRHVDWPAGRRGTPGAAPVPTLLSPSWERNSRRSHRNRRHRADFTRAPGPRLPTRGAVVSAASWRGEVLELEALALTDVLIDDPFVASLTDRAGEWRGSRHQRVIARPSERCSTAGQRRGKPKQPNRSYYSSPSRRRSS